METVPIEHDEVRKKMKIHAEMMHHKIDAESLREMLREKCRVRMREARQMRYDRCRGSPMACDKLPSLDKAFLKDTILRELNENLALEQEIMDEFLAESVELALKELENELDYYSTVEKGNYIICPICLMGELEFENGQVKCTCGSIFHYEGDRDTLRALMEEIFSKHQAACQTTLTFFTEPNEQNRTILSAVCKDCEYFYQV